MFVLNGIYENNIESAICMYIQNIKAAWCPSAGLFDKAAVSCVMYM